jgi:hypothetical protein
MKTTIFLLILSVSVHAQNLDQLAREFLETLPEAMKEETVYLLPDKERESFNFVPMSRPGPSFNDFTEVQKEAAFALLRGSLSETGFHQSREIMQLEEVLYRLENNNPGRDPLNYHICIFGDPFSGEYWGWRFEGHHLSLNFTTKSGLLISAFPAFWGSNPAYVRENGQIVTAVLKDETETGFQLVNMLSDPQMAIARFSNNSPREIITGADRVAKVLSPKGISYGQMDVDQQNVFDKLVSIYLSKYPEYLQTEYKAKLFRDGNENVFFAWAGSLKPGAGHYYRIQGPSLLIEYANTQNNANHVHTVVRDLENDFGRDLLKDHFEQH